MYSKAKIKGHPIHPMLIVFPVAFFTASFASFVAYQSSLELIWFRMGYIANVAGVVMAVIAAIPGFIDWAIGIPATSEAKKTGLIHMSLNLTALLLFAVNAWLISGEYGDISPDGSIPTLLTGVGFVLTLCAGYFGWTLVQKHHVGVDLSAAQERLDASNSILNRPHQQPT